VKTENRESGILKSGPTAGSDNFKLTGFTIPDFKISTPRIPPDTGLSRPHGTLPAMKRCPWAEAELQHDYHDTEWGVPSHDDRHLFEMIILEGAQAGLSWATILARREGYREAFQNFDVAAVARFDERRRARLLLNPGIIRHRQKIESAVTNAQAFLAVQAEYGSFDRYIWQFVGGAPLQTNLKSHAHIPATTPESDAMSRDLKKRGFKFVGSTICYAFMQATGMVNDHVVTCPRHRACAKLGRS
jgi:DNA-3-methyladenine glycosylase I